MSILKYGKPISSSLFRALVTPLQRLSTTADQEPILFETVGTAGVVTLNRPKKLNAMSHQMWEKLVPRLQDWEKNRSRLIIKGAGTAFCAGGDIKWLSNPETNRNKYAHQTVFSNGMYLISKYSVPYIALMDGIAFGGGCTVAMHGRYRVATERTLVSTPETRIGWLTDATATYLLPRLDNHLGFYMGLTGNRFKGKDTVLAGIATHFVPSARLTQLEADLCSCRIENIEHRLNAYSEPLGEFSLAPFIKDIDYCFSAGTVEEIIERLMEVDNSWSKETVETLARMCPTMLKVSLRALQHGKISDVKQCLRMENRVLSRTVGSYNAQEGVRALLVEKDGQPKWQPATLAEVSPAMVDSYFAPLLAEEEFTFYDEEPSCRILAALASCHADEILAS